MIDLQRLADMLLDLGPCGVYGHKYETFFAARQDGTSQEILLVVCQRCGKHFDIAYHRAPKDWDSCQT